MTAQPFELAAEPFEILGSTVRAELARAGRKYAIEALATFCLLSAVVMMLSPRTLVAALATQLAFTFVLSYVVLRRVSGTRYTPNKLADFAIGVAVLVGIAGALAGIAFLGFGSAGR